MRRRWHRLDNRLVTWAEGVEQPGQSGLIIAVESDCVVRSAERRQQRESGASELARSRQVNGS
jgi:hypothetical protein